MTENYEECVICNFCGLNALKFGNGYRIIDNKVMCLKCFNGESKYQNFEKEIEELKEIHEERIQTIKSNFRKDMGDKLKKIEESFDDLIKNIKEHKTNMTKDELTLNIIRNLNQIKSKIFKEEIKK